MGGVGEIARGTFNHLAGLTPGTDRSGILGSRLRYPGLGTLATSSPGIQAYAPWLRYHGDEQSWDPGLGALA